MGIISDDDSSLAITDQEVVRMRDRMASRGPDDATLLRINNVIFGHRRLAIRDQAGGKQPVVSPNGRYILTYNGEIYNDRQLKSELRPLGYQFHTRCDTEILIAAWEAWEVQCIEKLRGMFAFGIYDLYQKKLTLVRDRFGIKPLFYSKIQNDIVFASTIAAIKEHPDFRAAPNLNAIEHYLSTLRLTLGEQTLFEGISTVKPAELIAFQNGRQYNSTYWAPPRAESSLDIEFDEAVEQLESTLRESVSMRLISDVPVGMMLSGGVDSNSLAYIMKDAADSKIDARCGGGIDPDFNTDQTDFTFAKECAAENDLSYDEVTVDSESYLEDWQNLVTSYATPVSTPTDVIIHKLAKNLKQSVGVAIGGEGADEACCGYQVPHWSGADFDLRNSMNELSGQQAEIASMSLKLQYGNASSLSAGEMYLACNGLVPTNIQDRLLRQTAGRPNDRVVQTHYDAMFGELESMSTTEKTAHVLLKSNLESLLSRLDSATMLASLESRVPFADHLLVEQLFRLPLAYRIDVNPNEKFPLRSSLDLAKRGSLRPKRLIHSLASRLMPSRLANRPKASFPTPLPIWLNQKWSSWMESTLKSSQFAKTIFEPNSISQLAKLPSHLSMWKWPIMNLALWGDRNFG